MSNTKFVGSRGTKFGFGLQIVLLFQLLLLLPGTNAGLWCWIWSTCNPKVEIDARTKLDDDIAGMNRFRNEDDIKKDNSILPLVSYPKFGSNAANLNPEPRSLFGDDEKLTEEFSRDLTSWKRSMDAKTEQVFKSFDARLDEKLHYLDFDSKAKLDKYDDFMKKTLLGKNNA